MERIDRALIWDKLCYMAKLLILQIHTSTQKQKAWFLYNLPCLKYEFETLVNGEERNLTIVVNSVFQLLSILKGKKSAPSSDTSIRPWKMEG